MNAASVSRTLSFVPDRTARELTGSAFTDEQAARSERPERIQHVMRFLGWLGPLNPLTKDDLRILGLLNPYGKPLVATPAGEDEDTLESEEDLDPELEPSSGLFSETTLPPAPPQAP
jgi:hypothetical protein